MSDEPVQPPSGDVPTGESGPGSTPAAQPVPADGGATGAASAAAGGSEAVGAAAMGGAASGAGAAAGGGFVAAIMGSQFSAYALLLVASLVTITGSMYVLSSREDSRALLQMQISPGASLATETRADFRSDAGIRTVVIQFEDGVMQQAKEKVTNLAGAITAVSTKLVDEVRAEDAARAAALATAKNAFGASEAAALVPQVQPPPPRPTTPPQQPTAAPTQAPTQAPVVAAPTQVPPTAPPAVVPTSPPAAPTQTAAPPAPTQVPATATPLPPTATRTPEPSGGGGGGSSQPQPAAPAAAAPVAPVAPVVPVQAASTAAAQPTAAVATVPVATAAATFIPTAVLQETAVPILFGLNADGGANGHASAIIPATFNFQPGIPSAQTLTFSNTGVTAISVTFQPKTTSTASSTPTALWTDTTNGLQLNITQVSGGYQSTLYQGPLQTPANNLTIDLGVIASGASRSITMTVSLPITAPDTYQGLTQPVDLGFQLVSPPYANATATPQPTP